MPLVHLANCWKVRPERSARRTSAPRFRLKSIVVQTRVGDGRADKEVAAVVIIKHVGHAEFKPEARGARLAQILRFEAHADIHSHFFANKVAHSDRRVRDFPW